MTTREASVGDATAIAHLITQLGYPTTAEQMHARLMSLADDSNSKAFVSEVDKNAVGMIGVRVDRGFEYDGIQGRIVALVVDESIRGTGIGRSLVEAAECWARERSAHKMMVNTANHRTRTHDFYRSLGYETTGLRFVKPLR
ncbi:MAG: GNAT family N-acetyltransferase [Anaerolineae bacterium]|nr:GNAT family N-acetyltransferase [Phycisphaerae bacterium]